MCASIFDREAKEYGAMWHGCDWSTHTVLGSDPWGTNKDKSSESLPSCSPEEWKWEQPKPTDWSPSVIVDGGIVTVMFYTYSGLGVESIIINKDVYKAGNYVFTSTTRNLASGSGGYIF